MAARGDTALLYVHPRHPTSTPPGDAARHREGGAAPDCRRGNVVACSLESVLPGKTGLRGAMIMLHAACVVALTFAPAPFRPAIPLGCSRGGVSRIFCLGADDYGSIDAAIDELLEERKPERLPGLLGRRLDVLTDRRFLQRIEDRRAAAGEFADEAAELTQLGEIVVDFLEEVTQRVIEMEPELAAVEAEADDITAKAAEAASNARASSRPAPRATSAPPAGQLFSTAPPVPQSTNSQKSAREKAEAETRAKHRFMLERLLDAARKGGEALDELLANSRDSLDAPFFAHLDWEVAEQRRQQNSALLSILEVVVQRACLEVESGQAEVALLSALLQTSNQMQRREMYQRELVRMANGPRVATALVALVTETQLEIEKRVLRGEEVDGALLQMLRIIVLESAEYVDDGEMGV